MTKPYAMWKKDSKKREERLAEIIALGRALRGKTVAMFGDTDAAGAELQRAFTLADQLQSPSLILLKSSASILL